MKGMATGTAKSVLQEIKICAWCLGRQYSSSPNEIERVGRQVADKLGLVHPEICDLCGNTFKRRIEIVNRVIAELGQIEFATFQVGVTLPSDSIEKEDEMRSRLRLSSGISLKKGLTTMFRHELAKRLGKKPALRSPDITVRIGLPEGSIQLESKPVTAYVEYLKLTRGIPVRAMPCADCGGLGCPSCEGTGIEKLDESVEAGLTHAFLDAFEGRRIKISWSGIEEESSLLLGGGRPTYVEVVAPAKRLSGLMRLNMKPTKNMQLTRAELAPLDRERIEALVKEVIVTADFESELAASDVQLLEQAYKNRDLVVVGDSRGRRKRVYTLEVFPSGRRTRMCFVLDNGVNLRQILALKADSGGGQEMAQPSFADLLPSNRILAIESDVVGFRRADY
jgi:tRNA pseudouridine synthase 10